MGRLWTVFTRTELEDKPPSRVIKALQERARICRQSSRYSLRKSASINAQSARRSTFFPFFLPGPQEPLPHTAVKSIPSGL